MSGSAVASLCRDKFFSYYKLKCRIVTHSDLFILVKAQNIEVTYNTFLYSVTSRGVSRGVSKGMAPPPTAVDSYIIPNASLLPLNVSKALELLDSELRDGELTQRGYVRKRAELLKKHRHLVTFNGSLQFGGQQQQQKYGGHGGAGGEGNPHEGRRGHMELNRLVEGLMPRKLLQHPEVGGCDWGVVSWDFYSVLIGMSLYYVYFLQETLVLGWEESRRRFPWEKLHLFDTPPSPVHHEEGHKVVGHRSRRLLGDDMTDTFADSLRHVNRLYTKEYGHAVRKVPSHMPHYIQKDIMIALQDKFSNQYDATSSHPV